MPEGTSPRCCPRCGAALLWDGTEGLCPQCLMAAALASDSAEDTRTAPSGVQGSARAAAGLAAGTRLGPYELRRPLGRGGFAEVWEAEAVETGRRLALKVLAVAAELSPEAVSRFEREGRLAASLNDAHCVYVYAAGRIDGRPVIAMELMSGGTLQDVLRDEGPLPYRRAVDAILDVIAGLEAAQSLGIVHRDVKPSNCFLDGAGRALIGDFGLSKTLETDAALSASGGFLGTPSYASPEQVRGSEVDSRSDLYSVGATLYALLTGKPPFVGRSANEVLARILVEDPPPLATHGVSVPRGLEAVVRRAMSRARERRYTSYADLRRALIPFSSAGLTPAALVRRFAAIAIDYAVLWPLSLGYLMLFGLSAAMTLPGLLLGSSLPFLYFWLTDGIWGGTVGKRIMGLRVTSADDGPATLKQVLVRTLVYSGLMLIPSLVAQFQYSSGTLLQPQPPLRSLLLSLLQLSSQWFVPVTMRRRNGFAGVHELLSGTRVREVAIRTPLDVPAQARVAAITPASARFGPFESVGRLWQTRAQGLHLAWDALLRRQVWVHEYAADKTRATPSELAAESPGRLHWLQGSRSGDSCWDAYEAPTGTSLVDWVRTRGRLEWPAVQAMLLGVLEASSVEGQRHGGRSALEIWIDGGERVRLLGFPAVVDARELYNRFRFWPGPEAFEVAPEQWNALTRQALVLAAEGSLATHEELSLGSPIGLGVRVPLRARDFVLGVLSGQTAYASPQAMAVALRALPSVPAKVGRGRRLAALLATAAPALIPLLGAAFGLAMLIMSPGLIEVSQIPEYIRLAEDPSKPPPEREAARMLVASTWEKSRTSSLGEAIRSMLPERERALADAIVRDQAKVTEDDLRQARRLLKMPDPDAMMSDHRRGPVTLFLLGLMPLVVLAMLAPVATILSTVLRGPVSFGLLGIALTRNDDGAPASRRRCFGRAVLAWSPLIGVATATMTLGAARTLGWALPLALLAVAIVSALADPDRGLVDRLAGTRLVRR